MDDVKGMSLLPESANVWADVSQDREWKRRANEQMPSPSHRRQGPISLFFRGAAEWFVDMDDVDWQRIVIEGDLLSCHLNRAGSISQTADESGVRWKAELQYNVSHFMMKEAVQKLRQIPPSCIVPATISVRQSHIELLRFEARTLNCDLAPFCNHASRRVLAEKLLTMGIWFQTHWERVEEWIGFLARTGTLFGTEQVHEDVKALLRSSRVVAVLLEFCICHALPMTLQHFLEGNAIPTDTERTRVMLNVARPCDWAQWLILSRIPDQIFASTIANARCVLAAEQISVKTLADLAQADSIHVILTALAHSPKPLSQTLLMERPPVLTESPSQREELQVENGSLCLVDPSCCLADIEPQLQESYPETCRALRIIACQEKERGHLTFSEFCTWRNRMLRTELGEVGFLDMVMTSGIREIEKLLKMSQSTTDIAADPGQSESAQFWEEKQLRMLQEYVQKLCHRDVPEGISIGICHHLICGRPMAALEWFLASRQTSASPVLTDEELRFLEFLTRITALWFFKDAVVVFATLVFGAACGIDTNKIKIDVAALQRLDHAQGSSMDNTDLTEDLAIEVAMEYDAHLNCRVLNTDQNLNVDMFSLGSRSCLIKDSWMSRERLAEYVFCEAIDVQ